MVRGVGGVGRERGSFGLPGVSQGEGVAHHFDVPAPIHHTRWIARLRAGVGSGCVWGVVGVGCVCGGAHTVHSECQDEGSGEMPLSPPGVGGPCTTRCRLPAAAMPSAPLSPPLPAPSSAIGRGREASLRGQPVVGGGGGDGAQQSPPAATSPCGPAPPQHRQCAGGAALSLVGLPFSGNRRMASS